MKISVLKPVNPIFVGIFSRMSDLLKLDNCRLSGDLARDIISMDSHVFTHKEGDRSFLRKDNMIVRIHGKDRLKPIYKATKDDSKTKIVHQGKEAAVSEIIHYNDSGFPVTRKLCKNNITGGESVVTESYVYIGETEHFSLPREIQVTVDTGDDAVVDTLLLHTFVSKSGQITIEMNANGSKSTVLKIEPITKTNKQRLRDHLTAMSIASSMAV